MILYSDLLKTIGKNIRATRVRNCWSQEDFAEMAGVHTNYIGKIERGEQNLTIKKLVDIINHLNISIEDVLIK